MGDEAGQDGVLKEVAKGLRPTPAYLLVFGIVAAMTTAAGFLGRDNAVVGAVLVVGALGLAAFTIRLVETLAPTVRVDSPEQAGRISDLTGPEAATHAVLEGLADPERETYFVYSSSRVHEFLDHEGNVNPFEFREDEKVVTTIRDAWGIAMVHGLLYLGGKTPESLRIITAKEFDDSCWDDDLILIGSGFANPKSEAALRMLESPLRFSEDRKQIVGDPERAGDPETRWPQPGEDGRSDYGLITKLKSKRNDKERVYIVLAGLGPTGTLAACYYFSQHIVDLYGRFGSSPFGLVVRVDKDVGYISTSPVEGSGRTISLRI